MKIKLTQLCFTISLLFPLLVFSATDKAADKSPDKIGFAVFKAQTELKLGTIEKNQQKDFETQNVQISRFSERISDISFWLAIYAILTTVIAIILSFVAYISVTAKAKETAESWFNTNENGLKARIDELKVELEKHAKEAHSTFEAHKIESAKRLDDVKKNMHINLTNQIQPVISAADEAILKQVDEQLQTKPESKYTFSEWETRAVAAFHTNKPALAVEYFTRALEVPDITDEQVLRALFDKGTLLVQMNKLDDAFVCWDEVIRRFEESVLPDMQHRVSVTLKTYGLALLTQTKENWISIEARNAPHAPLSRALKLFNKAMLMSSRNKEIPLSYIAYTQWLLGKDSEAEASLRKALLAGGESLYQSVPSAMKPYFLPEDTRFLPEDTRFRELLEQLWSKIAPVNNSV